MKFFFRDEECDSPNKAQPRRPSPKKKKNRVKIGKKTPDRSLLLRRDPSILGVLGSLKILGPSIRRSPLSLETEHRPPPSLFLPVFPDRSRGHRLVSRRDCSPVGSPEAEVQRRIFVIPRIPSWIFF